jgi:very-short-patch-repair endonuclease
LAKLELTNIEKLLLDRLALEGIAVEPQYPVHSGHVIDFAILPNRIAIETDGERWHSSSKAKKRDRFKNYQLQRLGWTVLRFTGKQIENDMDSVILRIKEVMKPP